MNIASRKTRRLSIVAAVVAATSLSGCNLATRLSEVGSGPALTNIENPTAKPEYRPVSLPMPAPQVGRHAHNLILAEDQLDEAKERARKQGQRREMDPLHPDYSHEAHFGRSGRKGHGYAINTSVGYGKRNPNDVRSRPKKR